MRLRHCRFAVPLLGVVSSLAVLLATLSPALPAQAAGITRQDNCATTGSVALYTNASQTTLVDYFTFTNAPTQHIYKADGSYDSYVVGSGGAPGVSVTGGLTGTTYRFEFRDLLISHHTPSGNSIGVVHADWRVTTANGGVVADSRSGSVRVAHEGNVIVSKIFGPSDPALSGGLSTLCPS